MTKVNTGFIGIKDVFNTNTLYYKCHTRDTLHYKFGLYFTHA